MHRRRKWHPTPVFLPGESQGWGSLVGCRLWGHTESNTTEVTQQQQQALSRLWNQILQQYASCGNLIVPSHLVGASLIAQLVKNPPAIQETLVQFLGQEDPVEKG